jgi:hypothetical protein
MPSFNLKYIITKANPNTLSDEARVKKTIAIICPKRSSKKIEKTINLYLLLITLILY